MSTKNYTPEDIKILKTFWKEGAKFASRIEYF